MRSLFARSARLVPQAALGHLGWARDDVRAVLAEWDEVLDIDADDLLGLLQAVDRRRARS